MKQLKPIRYVDLETGVTHEERVYGGFWVKLLYGTWLGSLFSTVIAAPFFSRFYGWLQDRPSSRKKIGPFVAKFDIEMDQFLPEESGSVDAPYSTFNQFFIRQFTATARPVAAAPNFPAPCEARYFAYQKLDDTISVPVKGTFLTSSALLRNDRWSELFDSGPGFVARLCPADYHRFHFSDDGKILDTWRIAGSLHSVNPWALAFRQDIFIVNEREVTILDTNHFGKIAYVEVGAACVGKIKQTHPETSFRRGDEKGLFMFGGSTVIVLGEKGRWRIDSRIVENTNQGLETYIRMGQSLGESV